MAEHPKIPHGRKLWLLLGLGFLGLVAWAIVKLVHRHAG